MLGFIGGGRAYGGGSIDVVVHTFIEPGTLNPTPWCVSWGAAAYSSKGHESAGPFLHSAPWFQNSRTFSGG